MIDRTDPQTVLAATLWGEARGDGRIGMSAVASCVLNRVAHPRWWGNTILTVCLEPWQFSCWNATDPNLPQIEALSVADPDFRIALDISGAALAGALIDSTGGADSYYDIRMSKPPSWAARAAPTVRVLHHQYMRVELAAPSSGQPEAPAVSAHSVQLTADDLNQAELDKLGG